MLTTTYQFFTEWVGPRGQFYAQRHDAKGPTEARSAHDGAKRLHWAVDYGRPSVSDLYAITTDHDPASGRTYQVSREPIASGLSIPDAFDQRR